MNMGEDWDNFASAIARGFMIASLLAASFVVFKVYHTQGPWQAIVYSLALIGAFFVCKGLTNFALSRGIDKNADN